MLVSDDRPEKIGKNTVDSLSVSRLTLKIFAFKVDKFVTGRPPSCNAMKLETTSQPHD